MQVKKFIGSDMQDALSKVKAELGPDAVIFATRQVRPAGIFGPTRLEVSAALEQRANSVDDTPAVPTLEFQNGPKVAGDAPVNFAPDSKILTLRNELRGLREELRGTDIDEHRGALVTQLEELRKLLSAYSLKTIAGSDDWFVNVLENADIDLDLADEIGSLARKNFSAKAADIEAVSTDGYAMQAEALVEAVSARLKKRIYRPARKRNTIAVVGPTGVGKTTTIAKIAANASLLRKQTVGLITTDVYRVGAIEQIQQYAALIGIPMEAVNDAEGFRLAMSRFEKYDLVLIDTPGRNPGDHGQVPSMVEMFQGYGVSVHLAIQTATRQHEVREIVERYKELQPDAVILTKHDEAKIFGGIINAMGLTDAPVSYVTMGQRVPEDIARPDHESLAKEIVETILDGAGDEWRRDVLAEAENQARRQLGSIQQWGEAQQAN